jgi:putative membrane protein
VEERIPMMGWNGWGHMSGWGWFVVIVSSVLLIALVVGVIVLLARMGQLPRAAPPPPPRSAEELLAERFASGEITEDEYRSRLATLTGSGRRPTSPP